MQIGDHEQNPARASQYFSICVFSWRRASTGEPVGADCKLSCLRFHVFSPYLFTRSDASSLAVQLFGMSKSTAPWGSISVKEIRPDFHKTLYGFEIVPNHLRFTGS